MKNEILTRNDSMGPQFQPRQGCRYRKFLCLRSLFPGTAGNSCFGHGEENMMVSEDPDFLSGKNRDNGGGNDSNTHLDPCPTGRGGDESLLMLMSDGIIPVCRSVGYSEC